MAQRRRIITDLGFLFRQGINALAGPINLRSSLVPPIITRGVDRRPLITLHVGAVSFIVNERGDPEVTLTGRRLRALRVRLARDALTRSLVRLNAIDFLEICNGILNACTRTLALCALCGNNSSGAHCS